jgi:diaminopimelate epimerase
MSGTPFLKMPFLKMHGLGNDFVILDGRAEAIDLPVERRRTIAHRQLGVGCDQLIVMEPPSDRGADVFMRIYNPDGTEAQACGNATRCVASLVMDERKTDVVTVQTVAGLLESQKVGGGRISVDMGLARMDWREIPVARPCDTKHLPVELGALKDPVGTNMGNPHATFFVDDALSPKLNAVAAEMERHPFFPERVNVGLAQIVGENRLRLRVYERGTGFTLACGSGACAAGVAAARRGLTGRKVDIVVEHGLLTVEWLRDDHVLMTGGFSLSYRGEL